MSYDFYNESAANKKSWIWIRRPSEGNSSLPVKIEKAGYAVWGKNNSFRRSRLHREFTIEYVSEGSIDIFIEGNKFTAGKGEIYILPPGREHYYRTGPEGFAFKRFTALSGTELLNILPLNRLEREPVIATADKKKTASVFRKITDALKTDNNPDEKKLSILGYSLLIEIISSMERRIPAVVSDIIDYMTENLGRNISIETIASENRISISNLNKLFQQHTGTSPYRFYLDRKLQWAEQLLLNTSMSVKEISYKTGFDNPLYFSNSFRKKYILSPSYYRKSSSP